MKPTLLLLICVICVICGRNSYGADHPNIVFILADDQGYGDVTALNPDSKIPTPHLDRIAREGMYFTDAHTSSSVCTPTRYSILTGRYHWRTHLQSGVLGGFSVPLIAPGRLTIAGFLKAQGYHSTCIGKWHLGMHWPLKEGGFADDEGEFGKTYARGFEVDYEADIKDGPVDVGFDTFFGISASLDMPPYVYIRDRRPTENATVEKAFQRKGPAAESFEAVDVLPDLTEETVLYLASRAAEAREGQPFFVYLPLNAPHTPIVPSPEWEGKSGINKYADFTMQVDASVGKILDALDAYDLAANTLIIFTSDNGCSPQANFDELLAAGHRPSHIYRGHKADIFEGGHRVPFLVRWPGKVQPGTSSDRLIGQIDLLATCAEILGVAVPAGAGEDSVSFLPALLGDDEGGTPRASIVSQSIDGSFAIRRGEWKLSLCPGSGGWSEPRPGRDDLSGLPPVQLYSLAEDPGEETNLQAENPEIIKELTSLLEETINAHPNDVEIELVKAVPPPPKEEGKGRKSD